MNVMKDEAERIRKVVEKKDIEIEEMKESLLMLQAHTLPILDWAARLAKGNFVRKFGIALAKDLGRNDKAMMDCPFCRN